MHLMLSLKAFDMTELDDALELKAVSSLCKAGDMTEIDEQLDEEGNKRTASACKDHPVLKVKATRSRDRGANAVLYTTSLFHIAFSN